MFYFKNRMLFIMISYLETYVKLYFNVKGH
jgi:hypothetical protein